MDCNRRFEYIMPLVPVGIFSAYSVISASGNGFICGGNVSPFNKILKFNFASESISTSSATLSTSSSNLLAGASNKGTAGYIINGRDGVSKNANKLSYSSETNSTTGNIFATASYGRAAVENVSVAGYFTGGTGGGAVSATVEKLNFSNDTASITTSMPTGNYYIEAISNSGVSGYINRANTSGIYKLNFSNDTFSTVATAMTANLFQRYDMTALNNTKVAGYFVGGGGSGVYYNTSTKVSFTSDTGYIISGTLSNVVAGASSFAHTQYAGYVAGGSTNGLISGIVNTINKITFNTDTVSTISATTTADHNATGISNGGTI
jgi:hypothetical protein